MSIENFEHKKEVPKFGTVIEYIKENKKIVAKKAELLENNTYKEDKEYGQELAQELEKNKGLIWYTKYKNDITYRFIDKSGDINEVTIDPQQVDALHELNYNNSKDMEKIFKIIDAELESNSFTINNDYFTGLPARVTSLIHKIERKNENDKKANKSKDFDI
ncbi:MAG: hypothetical protein Q8Q23_06535 [bacterium]|nr:hypothetical protein [bacterium]